MGRPGESTPCVQAAFAAGYTYVLIKTNGEEHLLYDGNDPSYQGLNPQDRL